MDGCLLNTTAAFAKKWTEILGVKITPSDFNSWKHEWAFGIDPKLTDRFWAEIWDVPAYPYPEALGFIKAIKQLGFNFVILTSRPSTESIFAMHRDLAPLRSEIDHILVCDQTKGDRKSDYINETNGAEYFLDDHIKNVVDAKIHSPTLKEVFLIDRPWNTSKDIVGYRRVLSYDQIMLELLHATL